jgi:cell division initiation protein
MISAEDIRHHQFNRAIRGFDADEVKAFLSSLANEWQSADQRLVDLRQQVQQLEGSLQEYKTIESSLRAMLGTAQETADRTRNTAGQEAEQLVHKGRQHAAEILAEAERIRTQAQSDAKQLLAETNAERERMQRDILELRRQREELIRQLKSFLSTQNDRIEAFERFNVETWERAGDLPQRPVPQMAPAPTPKFDLQPATAAALAPLGTSKPQASETAPVPAPKPEPAAPIAIPAVVSTPPAMPEPAPIVVERQAPIVMAAPNTPDERPGQPTQRMAPIEIPAPSPQPVQDQAQAIAPPATEPRWVEPMLAKAVAQTPAPVPAPAPEIEAQPIAPVASAQMPVNVPAPEPVANAQQPAPPNSVASTPAPQAAATPGEKSFFDQAVRSQAPAYLIDDILAEL